VFRITDIGGQGQSPVCYGKGAIAVGPVSSRLVVMTNDAGAKSPGGIAGFYDAKIKSFVQLADAGGSMPARSGGTEC
jgi:hypothetical protein